jgi:uncharacterized protein DUF2865
MPPLRLPHAAILAAGSLVVLIGAATAQLLPPGSVPSGRANPPMAQGDGRNAVCARLENALGQLNSSANLANPNPEQSSRYEEAINRQRNELDQSIMQARRIGCDQGRGFFLFEALTRPAQCDQLNQQIGRMRNNLERMTGEMGQMRGDDNLERRQIIAALQENGCSQGRSAALPQPQRPRGIFESLFGGWREESNIDAQPLEVPMGSAFKTLCVRTCDGFYFPISYATSQSRFADDDQTCRRMCPATEVALYSHRNPGEEVGQAVSLAGRPYTELPTAFKYRQAFDPNCSCRAAGQSWADALGVDRTLQQGDIVVTEERARQMALPRPPGAPQAKGKGPQQPKAGAAPEQPAQTPAAVEQQPAQTPAKPGERRVRVVGPQFYPVR